MVNRNAARHLALVASILLCFFVYMGYRYHSQPRDDGPLPADPSLPAEATRPPADAGAPGPKLPVAGVAAGPAGQSRPETPSDPGRRPANAMPAPPVDRPAAPAGGLRPSPIPSGSLEETVLTAKSGDESTIITGLRPSRPGESRPAAPVSAPAADAPASAPAANRDAMPPPPGPATAPRTIGSPAPEKDQAGRVAPPPPSPPSPRRPAINVPAPAGTNRSDPDPPRPPAPRPPPPGPGTPAGSPGQGLRQYVIRSGDTLSRIAARELGSAALANNIYLLNRDVVEEPDRLMVGTKIRLPGRETGEPAAVPPERSARPGPEAGPAGARRHRVARGDTLSSLSLRYYGYSGGWPLIHEANRQTIPNPNRLEVGMDLIIPPSPE